MSRSSEGYETHWDTLSRIVPRKVSSLSVGPSSPTVRVAPLVKWVSSHPSLTTYPLCMSLVIIVG